MDKSKINMSEISFMGYAPIAVCQIPFVVTFNTKIIAYIIF